MFKKQHRLNTSLFKEVFNFGKTIKTNFFLIKKRENNVEYSRFAVVVSKKISKKATERNHLRRRTYFALREVYKNLPVADYIFILNSGAKDIQYKELVKSLQEVKF